MFDCEFCESGCAGEVEGSSKHQHRISVLPNDARKAAVVLCRTVHGHRLNPKPQRWARSLDGLQARTMRRRGGVPDDRDKRERGNGLLEQFHRFDARLRQHDRKSCDVATRARQTVHVATFDWPRVAHEYDRNRRRRSLGYLGVDRTRHNNDIDLEPNQFLCQLVHAFQSSFCPSVLDGNVPTFTPT